MNWSFNYPLMGMSTITKIEILQKLEKLVSIKIEGFENDIQKLAPTMNEHNLSFFLDGQGQLIEKWRQFAAFLKKHKNRSHLELKMGPLLKSLGILLQSGFIYTNLILL